MASLKDEPPRSVLKAVRALQLLDGYEIQELPERDSQPGWWITASVTGLLPSRRRNIKPDSERIGDKESVRFFFSDENIDGPPRLYLRPDFPKQIHHFTERSGGLGPSPCLTDESLDEFYYSAGFVGVLHQLREWLLKAATGKLSNSKDGWEATPTYSASVLISEHDKLRSANDPARKNGGWAYVGYRREAFPSGSVYQYDLTAGETYDPSKQSPASGCIGGIHFHTAADLAPIPTQFNSAEITNAGELATFVELLGVGSMQFGAAFTTIITQAIKLRERETNGDDVLVPISFQIPRPHHIAGTASSLELFCFVIVWKSHWDAERAATNFESAEVLSGRILPDGGAATRARLSGYTSQNKFDLAGAGSLGSKMALSLCRAGWICTAVFDPDVTLPHNMARYGVPFPSHQRTLKRELLAQAISCFQVESISLGDDIRSIDYSGKQYIDVPSFLINTTADNRVSDTLGSTPIEISPSRLIDASLMLRGNVGLLIIEGENRSPSYHDMFDLAMLRLSYIEGLGEAIMAEQSGFDRIDVGGGCGAFTMVASDATLSTMSGLMSNEILAFGDKTAEGDQFGDGVAVLWHIDPNDGSVRRVNISSKPFSIIPCEVSDWTIRISPAIVEEMERAQNLTPDSETGGYLIGHVSERRKEISVVALIPPPPDSTASASQITLGTEGVKDIVKSLSVASAGYLVDVGTWHSHLTDAPPSSTDHQLVSDLKMEPNRLLPYAMIVRTPERFHAVLADPVTYFRDPDYVA